MSTTEANATGTIDARLQAWQGGVLGGLLGGLVFGALMSMQMPGVLESAIPNGMYGLGASGEIGWVIHMSHSAVLGVVFAVGIEFGGFDATRSSNLRTGLAGLGYGLVVWAVLAAIVMPIWVSGGSTAGVPNIVTESIVGHAVYGVLLGISYSVLSD